MAVNLFKIIVNGIEYVYTDTDGGTWQSNGATVTAPQGISVDTTKKNSDGTYDVTVNKAAFSKTIGEGTTVSLQDLNEDDRQTYRLALGSGYTSNELYGARQTVNYSVSGAQTTVKIDGITAGLLVNAAGTSITYETPTGGTSATLVITNLQAPTNSTVNISGRTVIVGASALPNDNNNIELTTNASDAYSLALGRATTDGKISQKTEAGWDSVASGSQSAIFYSDAYTKGYYKVDYTHLANHTSSVQSELFRVDGISSGTTSAQLGSYFDVNTTLASSANSDVSLTSAGFDALKPSGGSSAAITITDAAGGASYRFAIGSGVNTNPSRVYASLTSDYKYQTAGNSAYATLAASTKNTITVYSAAESKSFSLSGLATGQASTGAVSIAEKDGGFVVTLGQSALHTENIYAYGDYASLVSFSAAKDVTDSLKASIIPATISMDNSGVNGVLTYVAAGAATKGYDFQTNQVIYYSAPTASRDTITIAGFNPAVITKDNYGTITPQATGATTKTFNIALNNGVLGTLGNSSKVSITSGTPDLHYSLKLGSLSAYGKDSNPNASASSLTYNATNKQYTYTGQYIPAYLSGTYANASVLGAGSTAVYSYKDASAHPEFTLTGLNNAFGDGATGADANKYFTVADNTESGGGSYVVNFTPSGVSALLLGSTNGATLTITDSDPRSVKYLMANPKTIKSVTAGFSGVVTGGKIKYNAEYKTSGWSAAAGTNGSYSSAFTFVKQENQDYAFSLSGLTDLDNASLSYAGDTGVITVKTDTKSFTLGTLTKSGTSGTSGTLMLNKDFFDQNTSISSITLIDNDANDGVLYTLKLGTGMSGYGAAAGTMGKTHFATVAGEEYYYEYESGGLQEGYGLYLSRDALASLSAGTTTVKHYNASPESKFTIGGLTNGLSSDGDNPQVLDYVEIDSKETLEYYLKTTTGSSRALAKGNYKLTADITLDYTLNISAGKVAIDLGGKTLTNTNGSAFSLTSSHELIINDSAGSGSILATAESSTAITVGANGRLIVNGGHIEGKQNGISNNNEVLINGGTILGQTTSGSTTTGTGIEVTNSGKLIVAGGTVTGGKDGINMIGAGSKLDITGGTVTGTTGAGVVVNESVSEVNVIGGTVKGSVGLSVTGGSSQSVNIIGGSVISSGDGYAITNTGSKAINIGRATIGSLSGAAGGFSLFADYSGNTYASINGATQNYKNGSYSGYFTYSDTFTSILNGVTYPTVSSNRSSAVIVGASAGGYITLNRAALSTSTASLSSGSTYGGLSLGSDVTSWDKRKDPTVTEGWTITDAKKAGDSAVDKATYKTAHYLESWALSGKNAITHYAETGGTAIGLSGLNNIVAQGTSVALTDASLGSFFSVSATGGTTMSAPTVTGYTLTIANNDSLFSALDGGEALTFTVSNSNYSLSFADGISKAYRTAIDSDTSAVNNYTHSALASLTGTGAFLYTASGVEDYYNLAKPTKATPSAKLEHVKTEGLQQFSLSGLGDKFSAFSALAIKGSNSVALIGIAGGVSVTIGTIEGNGLVKLNENAFTTGASQKITLTDLDMSDGVYYVLDKGNLKEASGAKLDQTVTSTGGSSYTFVLGGSYAYYTVTKSASAVGGQSSSYIQYTPQVGGQSFVLTGLPTWTVSGNSNVVSIMSGGKQVGSISFSDTNVIYGGTSKASALVTLTDVAAMGNAASVAFAFKDSDSLDSMDYSFSLGSAFKEGSKPAKPDVEATFTSVTSGYSYTSPAYDNYTVNKGSGSYVYYAPETPKTLTITGLSVGLAASGVYAITSDLQGASGITTVAASGTRTGTLFTVENAGGSLNVVVYEGALSSGRKDIIVTGAALSGLSLAGDLGKSGVLDASGGFGSIAGGSFTYTADSFKDYYTVQNKSGTSITAKHYDGTGGQSFTFSGLSTGNLSNIGLTVAGLSSAIAVKSTSSTESGYQITGYTFEVGSVSLLRQIPQGQSLSVKVNDSVTVALSITDSILAKTDAQARKSQFVGGQSGLKPLSASGAAKFEPNGGGSFTYTAQLANYDWYSVSKAVITHEPQTGGQTFSLSGVNSIYGSDYTYKVGSEGQIKAFDSNNRSTTLALVAGSSVYLTAEAFGSGSTITLTDGYDGAGNVVNYSLSYSTATGYLNEYSSVYTGATFASLDSDSLGRTYLFTASGINDGISIVGGSIVSGTANATLKTTTATYYEAVGSEQFNLSGLRKGMPVLNAPTANATLTSFKIDGASVIDVKGISTGNINVMVYEGALSEAGGRSSIVLTGVTEGKNYSLSLASSLLLGSDNKPIQSGESLKTAISLASGSGVWTAPKYKDYYIIGTGADSLTATHYNVSGGQSFRFSVLSSATSSAVISTFSGGLSVLKADGSLTDGQYELNNFVFGISKAALSNLNNEQRLTVAGQSGYEGAYSLSFIGKTGHTAAEYASDVIMTQSVSSVAKFTSGAAGSYTFADSVGNYAWYERSDNNRQITFHDRVGGESFSISGLASNLSGLAYDATTGVITSGNVTIGAISFAKVSNSSASRYGYVYLTENAFGGDSATVTLTDSDKFGDGTYYSLVAYKGDTTKAYLQETGDGNTNNVAATFDEYGTTDGRGNYRYIASVTGAGVDSSVNADKGITTLKYIAQKGGQSFTITNLAAGLNASVNGEDIVSGNVTIGTVKETGKTPIGTSAEFEIKSFVAMGSVSKDVTIKLDDSNATDGVDYTLKLDENVFHIGETKATVASSVKEEGSTGVYNVQVGGISAWAEEYDPKISYLYHPAQNATTYAVAGLKSGLAGSLSAAALAKVFGESAVTLNDSVVPDQVTTVQIRNNATIGIGYDSLTIASTSLASLAKAQRSSNTEYAAQTYKPWTNDTDTSDGLTVYPSVGGEKFSLTGFNSFGADGLKDNKILTTNGGTITAGVELNASTGEISKYTFTVSGRSALASDLKNDNTIAVSLTSNNTTPEYTLSLSGAIAIGTGGASGQATLTYDNVQHKYKTTGRTDHAEVSSSMFGDDSSTLVHAYTYHDSVTPQTFIIQHLKGQNLSLGSDVIVEENWSGNSLSRVDITLTGGALAESIAGDIDVSGFNGGVSFALSNAGSLSAGVINETLAGNAGDYFYQRLGTGKGYKVSDDKEKVEYYSIASGGQSFTLTGLATGLGELNSIGGGSLYAQGISAYIGTFVNSDIAITNKSALGNRTITLTDPKDDFPFNLNIADSLLTDSVTGSSEKVDIEIENIDYRDKLVYTAAVSAAHYTPETINGTSATQYVYTYEGASKIGADFYFDGAFDSVTYNRFDYGYSVTGGVITATQADKTPITLASISDDTITVNKPAFSDSLGSTLYLTYINKGSSSFAYKLALGTNMEKASVRLESFKESLGVYHYEEAGNSEGYQVINYNGLSTGGISYTGVKGGNNFDLKGLRDGMSLTVAEDGTIYNTAGGTSVPVGTYGLEDNSTTNYRVTLYDAALPSVMSGSQSSVILSNISNAYDTNSTFGIGNMNFNLSLSGTAVGTVYASNGGSFAAAEKTSSGYSITYQANPKDAYWRNNGRKSSEGIISYTYMPARGASNLFSIGSFSTSVTGSDFIVNNGDSLPSGGGSFAVNVATNLLPDSVNTVVKLTDSDKNDGYDFYFAATAGQSALIYASGNSPSVVAAHFSGNVFTADYRETYTSLGSDSQTLTYVAAQGGESFSITGLNVQLSLAGSGVYAEINGAMSQVGTLTINGKNRVLELTNAAVLGTVEAGGQRPITLTDLDTTDAIDYSLTIKDGNNFYVGGNSARNDNVIESSVTSGSYTYQLGAVSTYTTYTTQGVSGVYTYTYNRATSGTEFGFTGLVGGLSGDTAAFGLAGTSFTLQEKALLTPSIGSSITFTTDSENAHYVLNNPDEREQEAANFHGDGKAVYYKEDSIASGYDSVLSGTTTTYTYAGESGGNTRFAVTGLSSTFNATGMSYSVTDGNVVAVVAGTSTIIGTYDNTTFTLNATGLSGATGTVSLNGNGNLALAGVSTTAGTTDAHWVDDSTGGVSYVTASNDEYWSVVSANKAYKYQAQSGGETIFGIHGLSTAAASFNEGQVAAVSIQAGGYSVTVDSELVNTAYGDTVSITGDKNELYFSGKIDTTTAAGYASLQQGGFNSTTYSIAAYNDQMIAVNANKKNAYRFEEGSETPYSFGITAGLNFNESNFTPSLMSGGNSIVFTQKDNSSIAAILDKDAQTVYVYKGLFNGNNANRNITLTNPENVSIAIGTGNNSLTTTPGEGSNYWTGTNLRLFQTGRSTDPYFSRTNDTTLQYVTVAGGHVFVLNHYPDYATKNYLTEAISVSTNDGATYTFTINDPKLRDYAVGGNGLSIAVYEKYEEASLSLAVAFAVNDSLGNNTPVPTPASLTSVTGGTYTYTAIGTESYYKNVSSGYDLSAVASLESVASLPGEPFTISGFTAQALLGSDSVSIITTGNRKLAGIEFAGEKDSLTGRYNGDAYVRLTTAAFDGKDNATITVVDGDSKDAINYSLSSGDGVTYLATLGGYTDEKFDGTNGTYNYSASTREQGITIDKTVATYSASAGYGNTFGITGLADGLTVKGGKALAGTATVGAIDNAVFTLTSLSALSAAAQNFGATTTFTLTDNAGGLSYSLAVSGDLSLRNAGTINETLTGASGVFTYAAAHSSAYVTKAKENSYTYGAEAKHDTFELSGNGLAASLSLGSLSISGKTVTLLDTATLAGASAGDTIVFNGDKDGDGTYYTIAALSTREDIPRTLKGTGDAITYFDDAVSAGWSGAGGSAATFTYSALTGGASLFTVNGLSAAYTGASVSYTIAKDGSVVKGGTTPTPIGTFGASTLTLNETALAGASFVNLKGAGYSLALDQNVAQSASVISAAGFADGTRTYYSAELGSYWSASGANAYTFNAASASAAQFSLSGVGTAWEIGGIEGVSVADSTVVTINNAALTGVNVTLTNLSSATYSLSLGSDVVTSASGVDGWTYEGAKATYVLGAVSAYYTKETDTQISFHDSVAGSSAVVLDGIRVGASLAAITADNAVVLHTDNFSTSGVTVIQGSASYSFTLSEGTYNNSFTGMSIADSVTNSGSYIAINVGAGDDFINLAGGTSSTLTLGEGKDTISVASGVSEFTVTDFTADDVIVGSFSSIETVDGGIKAGDVVIKGITGVAGTSTGWAPSGDNINYVSTSTSGAVLDGNKITLVSGAGESSTLFTIFNVNSTLGVSLDNTTVTLGQSALANKTAVSLSGTGYSLTLDGNVAQSAVTIKAAGFGGTTTYSLSSMSSYWSASGNNAYKLNESTAGAAQFSIAGATALADSIVSGTTVNIGETNLTNTDVTLTNLSSASYSLTLDTAVKGASILPAGFTAVTANNSASYLSEGNTAGYSLAESTLIAYTPESLQSTLFTLTGISNTAGIEPTAAKVVTVADTNVAQGASVIEITGTKDYTLAVTGLNTIGTPSTAYAFGTVKNNSASYIATTTYKDYWTPATAQKYTFTSGGGTSTSTVFTINGIATIENKAVSGTTVTLGEKNFAGKNISLNGADYSLALDGNYDQSVTAGGFGSLVSGAATYYGEGTSDGYSLTSTTLVTFTKGQSGAELFTASNITSTDNVNYAASAITASNEANAKLTLTNLSSALTIDGFVEIDGINATNQTVAGTPTDAAASGSNLVVTTADGTITIDGAAAETVNMAGADASYTAAFDRITDVTDAEDKSVTLTAGFEKTYYGLHYSYANGVTAVDASKANTDKLTLTGTKSSIDVMLTGASNAINTIIGGKGNDTLTGGGQGDSLKGNAGNDIFVQSAGTDTITDYTANEDTIQLIGTLANTAADSVNVTLNTADGNAIVVENGVGQVIKTVDNTSNEDYILYLPEAPINASVSSSDLVVTADKDYTFAGASAATVTVFTSEGGTYTVEKTRITDITNTDAKAVTLTTDFTNTYYGLHQSYGAGVYSVDASQANTSKLNLTGTKSTVDVLLTGAANAANTIIGGKGNDTLTGGGQGDSLKGNAGNDIFVQSAGNDTITDYVEGEDAIQLLSTETGRETVSSDVVITTAEGTILIQNGAGKEISVIGGETPTVEGTPIDSKADGSDLLVTLAGGKTTTFAGQADATVTMSAGGNNYSVTADRITDYTTADAKAVTLSAGFSGTYYGLHQSYGKGVTAVDATKAVSVDKLSITGYKSADDLTLTGAPNAANNITGGTGDDTLTGGGQNDTLKGNAGADLFVQSAGNDTITDYTAGEDVISLVSALSSGSVSGENVILTTEDGNTIQLTGGKDQSITTNYNGNVLTTVFGGGETPVVEDAPVDVTLLASGNLSIELANGDTITVDGETHTMTAGGNNYSVTSDRITDYTDESDKKVTLAGGFSGTYYGLHQSYGKGVTAVDASKANSATLALTGFKSTVDVELTGAANATNNVTGGAGNDTLTGGTKNDSLKGNAGADIFVQSGGNDTILDYTEGDDIIILQSSLTAAAGDSENVTLTTEEGNVIVQNGVNKTIITKTGADGEYERKTLFLSEMPSDISVSDGNLVATVADSKITLGASTDTVHFSVGDQKFKAEFDRIVEVTNAEGRTVTLTSGFEKSYYGLHYSYSEGVTTVDATAANTTSLNIAGFKSEVALKLMGADKANNTLLGGKADDTLMGGTGNNTLKGNAGADWFVQNGKTDVIVDYAEEDTIQLVEEVEPVDSGTDVTFTNKTGTITVLNGKGLNIKTTVANSANNAFATSNDELWGVNGVKDTFLFDGGKDTIHNYEEQDSINLGGYSLSDLVNGAPAVKDNSLVFEFDRQNAFTVADAVGKTISFTDGATYSRDKK